MRYRRANVTGGTYFFTVNLADRRTDLLTRHINDLREVIHNVKDAHPFSVIALVVLPEHLYAIWRLPLVDIGFSMRWSLIKAGFSRRTEKGNRSAIAVYPNASEAFGSTGIGNIKLRMKPI